MLLNRVVATAKRSVGLTFWATYARVVRLVRSSATDAQAAFEREGWVRGSLLDTEARSLVEAFSAAGSRQFIANDSAPSYVSGYSGKAKAAKVTGTTFLDIGPTQAHALSQALSAMSEAVTDSLGTPWRVVNVRCWRTLPNSAARGANEWHVDGFPTAFFKIMLYLTPASAESGTTELVSGSGKQVLVSGPAGTWLLFKNGVLKHRGVIPTSPVGERVAIEITIARALRRDLSVVVAGMDAKYPRFPWTVLNRLVVESR